MVTIQVRFLVAMMTLFMVTQTIAAPIKIAAKTFTESVILGEIVRLKLKSEGVKVRPVEELGDTAFVWQALLNGEIDIYVDYTGTLIHQMFSKEKIKSFAELKRILGQHGLGISEPLGFENSSGIGMLKERAQELGISSISQLKSHPHLNFHVGHDFFTRPDGYLGLAKAYRLPFKNVGTIEHTLAYQGLAQGKTDVINLYTTEAEIDAFNVLVLNDDLDFFPDYEAVVLYRNDSLKNILAWPKILASLAYSIKVTDMRKMNAQVLLYKHDEAKVAAEFLGLDHLVDAKHSYLAGMMQRFIDRGLEHLGLVTMAMFFATIIGIFLGVICFRFVSIGSWVLMAVSILQTIPSLALLVLMIPIFGIGTLPATVALFLYALLPIVRNTLSGLSAIPKSLIESAYIIGLSGPTRLLKIEMPMASRHILGGLKTATIICVGTATLGALIGAGGYGKPILTGIRLLDMGLILEGAIPSALMALVCQLLFVWADKLFIPKALRIESAQKFTA